MSTTSRPSKVPAETSASAPAQARVGWSRRLVVHPVLFAALPVLILWAGNVREGIALRDVLLPMGVAVASAVAVLAVGTVVLRSPARAGLVTTVLLLSFFSYGWVASALEGTTVAGVDLGNDTLLLAVWAVLTVALVATALRVKGIVPELTSILNVVAAGLVIVNVAQIGRFELQNRADERAAEGLSARGTRGLPDPRTVAHIEHRDVYYLMFEEYAGEQTMERVFGYDNAPFLQALEERGFFVAHESTTNYPRTSLSLASSMNMQYLDFLTQQLGRGSNDFQPLNQLMKYNQVAKFLTSTGYRYVHIGSWWGPTKKSPLADDNVSFGGASELTDALLGTTVIRPVSEDSFRTREWKRVQLQFRAIAGTRDLKEPTYVFAHLLIPHAPFVFNPDGSLVTQGEAGSRSRRQNYVNQVRYVNAQLLALFDRLLARPADEQPIIILQADEGPFEGEPTSWRAKPSANLDRKFPILNAYYLPGKGDGGLPATVTPVNSFRAVFNMYFGAHLAMLPDRNFVFTSLNHLYDFTDVTPLVRAFLQRTSGGSGGPSPPSPSSAG